MNVESSKLMHSSASGQLLLFQLDETSRDLNITTHVFYLAGSDMLHMHLLPLWSYLFYSVVIGQQRMLTSLCHLILPLNFAEVRVCFAPDFCSFPLYFLFRTLFVFAIFHLQPSFKLKSPQNIKIKTIFYRGVTKRLCIK